MKKTGYKTRILLSDYPKALEIWDYNKNTTDDPKKLASRSHKIAHWKCNRGPDHEWIAPISRITTTLDKHGTPCPVCSGLKVTTSNSLATVYPEIAKTWHPTKNGNLKPDAVTAHSNKRVWWKCPKADDHEWEAMINNRVKQGCPFCSGRRISKGNNLEARHHEIAKEWHPTKNGNLKPDDVTAQSNKRVWWVCQHGHEYSTKICHRTGSKSSCPYCSGHKLTKENSLEHKRPDLTREWHPTKNESLKPDGVHASSRKLVWWQCQKDPSHEWQSTIDNRNKGNGCPYCNKGWTLERFRLLVASLLPYLPSLTEVERYVLCMKSGVLGITRNAQSNSLVKAFVSNKLPQEELMKFTHHEPSLIDDLAHNLSVFSEEILVDEEDLGHCLPDPENSTTSETLPVIQTKDILKSIDNPIFSTFGKEDVDFFIHSAIAKIWQHVFVNEREGIHQLEQYQEKKGLYSSLVKTQFLKEYEAAKKLIIPKGYNFTIDGVLQQPNLMQLYTACLLKMRKRMGNWSGTGSGKTLAAVLSSRVIESKLTIICCPNNVVDGWSKMIKDIYPNSQVFVKDTSFDPTSYSFTSNYLVVNYEIFQSPKGRRKLRQFAETYRIDFIIIDEIHFSKQRGPRNASIRKQEISSFLDSAQKLNNNLHVLGMSATPVINNLFEGKTLLELVSGKDFDFLNTRATVPNCVMLHQHFVTHGIRFRPEYTSVLQTIVEEIDCIEHVPEIKKLGLKPSADDLDGILAKAKIPYILQKLRCKTLIYVHFWNKNGVLVELQNAIENAGWSVATFTGESKEGLKEFLYGNADVLIASSCIGTGVDGLQRVCSRLIVTSLPWTHAEFEQLKGRIFRQGQKSECVEVFVPLTYAIVNENHWSYCQSRWELIKFKKAISDTSVDGVIPEGYMPTEAQITQASIKLLHEFTF